jgi:hypothetical protein
MDEVERIAELPARARPAKPRRVGYDDGTEATDD